MIVSANRFTITDGATKAFRVHVGDSEYAWEKCVDCQTDLYAGIQAAPEIVAIWAGTLDDTSWFQPKAHVWTKSAQSWFRFTEADVVYEGQPPDLFNL